MCSRIIDRQGKHVPIRSVLARGDYPVVVVHVGNIGYHPFIRCTIYVERGKPSYAEETRILDCHFG